MNRYTIIEALTNPDNLPESGWFYLPPNPSKWNSMKEGVFSLDSQDFPNDSNDHIPKEAFKSGWIETLDKELIEDVIYNLREKNPNPSNEDLLKAFVFYFENDAFIQAPHPGN